MDRCGRDYPITGLAALSLAFLAVVENNRPVSFMRLARGLTIVFLLSLPFLGIASPQPDRAGSANASEQEPNAPVPPPAEQVPADNPPAAGQKTMPESAAKKKAGAGPASTPAKHGKSMASAPAPVPAPDGGPRKVVVREGGANEPTAQIVPGMTPAEAVRRRQNAERLLTSTDEQLKQLAERTLNAHQEDTVGQIRNYMEGARSALKEGDVQRASTLAEKAHLLAKDLAKH